MKHDNKIIPLYSTLFLLFKKKKKIKIYWNTDSRVTYVWLLIYLLCLPVTSFIKWNLFIQQVSYCASVIWRHYINKVLIYHW